jgi:hypothetical protein
VGAIDRAGNASYGSTSVRVYPTGTDLSRPDGYDESAELTAITQSTQDTKTNTTKLLITLILGAVLVVGIILAKKKKNKS